MTDRRRSHPPGVHAHSEATVRAHDVQARAAERRAAALRAAALRPPEDVVTIVRTLEKAGFESWCVGGAVRDALLGLEHLDWDIATAATPKEVQRLFRRTVPVGIEFGTVRVFGTVERDRLHEVTTFRRDVQTDGRHAVVEFGASLDEDLARRDFTINAIAYHPTRELLHDPFDGQADIRDGIVRAVGEPDARMREDRLRALRAIRFAARFDFAIDPATWDAIRASAPHLGRLSAERVKQELDKTFEQVERSGSALRLWRESGALRTLIPPLADVRDEILAALDCQQPATGRRAGERRIVAYAVLFSGSTGKKADGALHALRFSNAERRMVATLVALQGDLCDVVEQAARDGAADSTLRRWIARAGRTEIGMLMRILALRWAGRRAMEQGSEPPPAGAAAALHRRILRIAYRDPVSLADLAVNGDDLREAGISPGPQMARILHRLLDAVLEDPGRNRVDELLAVARAIASESDTPDTPPT